MKEAVHYFNGNYVLKRQIQFSIDDVSILRGYAVFDFFKAIEGVPIFIADHLDRLENSASKLNLQLPNSREEIERIIKALHEKNQFPYSSFKIIVTGGESTDGFSPGKSQIVILNNEFSNPSSALYEKGISLMLNKYQRDFPDVKSTYYVQALSLQEEWLSNGHMDVLYHDGIHVSEVSRCNVFYFDGETLRTNQLGVLSGVTRKNVLKCAENHFKVDVGPILLDDLLNADEVFITSSAKKVMAVVKLDNQIIGNGLVGENTKKLMTAFDLFIDHYFSENKKL